MALLPLDLQVMFSQLDVVGKSQAALKEGAIIQRTLQNAKMQEKADEHIQEINEAQNTGEGAEGVKDRGNKKQNEGGSSRHGGKQESSAQVSSLAAPESSEMFDPQMGKFVDLSG